MFTKKKSKNLRGFQKIYFAFFSPPIGFRIVFFQTFAKYIVNAIKNDTQREEVS